MLSSLVKKVNFFFLSQLPQRPLSKVNSERVDLSDLVAVDTHCYAQHPDSSSSSLPSQIKTIFSRKITVIAFFEVCTGSYSDFDEFLCFFQLMVGVQRGVVMKVWNDIDNSCKKWTLCTLNCTLIWPLLSVISDIKLTASYELCVIRALLVFPMSSSAGFVCW